MKIMTITSRVDTETSFTEPTATGATSTLRLRQKIMRDKIISLYRHLGVIGDPGLADLDRFTIKRNSKTDNIECSFSMVINTGNPLLINGQVSF